jgi:hypothetical protein
VVLPFIAQASDFDGFHAWPSFFLSNALAPGDAHINGPRRVYINRVPPKGSEAFPVGTILVKESDTPLTEAGVPPAVPRRTVFASVKRGGGYDPKGDVDWEWFALQNLDDGTERVLWRGPGPASGGVYGNGLLGGCSTCHKVAKKTDYVLTQPLQAMLSPRKG